MGAPDTSAFRPRPDTSEPTELLRRAPLDYYFSALAKSGATAQELFAAGFIVDSLPAPVQQLKCWNPQFPTTSVGKLLSRLPLAPAAEDLPADRPLVVLLSTGSFSPVHMGHIAMMETAKQTLEAKGFFVLGGYMSASHDEYVSIKQDGRAAMHAENRLALLEHSLAEHPWLDVCPWEARYAPGSLNFTDVMLRLQAYLDTHLAATGRKVEVAYVFGADNVRFLEAFREQGLAVCVQRDEPDAVTLDYKARVLAQKTGARWFWCEPTEHAHASSSRVRAGDKSLLHGAAEARYSALRHSRADSASAGEAPLYLVRNDLEHGAQSWDVPAIVPKLFGEELVRLLSHALRSSGWQVRTLDVSKQQAQAQALSTKELVLSLDVCSPVSYQLNVSRLFPLSGGQVRSTVMVPRPGFPDFSEQLAQLPRVLEPWTVIDDDQSTGRTEAFVRKLLESSGRAVGPFRYLNEMLLSAEQEKGAAAGVADVVDARDFLFGAKDAGLVVQLPNGKTARAPYMLPFVNLGTRARIPAEEVVRLSADLWAANAAFYGTCPTPLLVRDMDQGAQELLAYLGFAPDAPMSEVCAGMAAQLA